jgi:threonine dehydratase
MKQALIDTAKRINPYIHRTPVLQSTTLNEMSGAKLFFKCENFQKMGAFKMRGAANAVLSLSKEDQSKGVVTHSSGNFAQAVALSAKNIGAPAYIVMPENAPQVKVNAVKGYGGQVTKVIPTIEARESTANQIAKEKGATKLHPSNQIEVILGQGTAAMELLEDHPNLNILMTPIGGGGLVAGTALVAHYFGQDCITIGAEPLEADDAYRSLQSGKIERNETADTIADGLRTVLGDVNFPIIQKHVDQIWERMKIIIEPSCAVPLAAVLGNKELFKNKHVGIILSGGNVDLGNLPF